MFKDLFEKQGFYRLIAIDRLNRSEIDIICRHYKSCGRCPLGLIHRDPLGIERVLCVDVSRRKAIEAALNEGGHFINEGEFKR